MNNEESFRRLSEHSDMAKRLMANHSIHIICLRGNDDFSFHPNGKCGCITLNDESMFGIRCNHLMWAEGWIEGAENNLAILVYGNHKGVLEIVLLTFSEKEGEYL